MILTLVSMSKHEVVYCDGFLDVVESEDVVSAGFEAAGNNDYQVLIYCSGGRNNLTLILCKASNGELRRQILRLAVHNTISTQQTASI